MIKKYIHNPLLANIAEWVATFAAAAIIYLLAHTFIFRVGSISGPSMEPTLIHGDRVVIAKFSYWLSKPAYGDIVAFPYKENNSQHYVKRIVGLPGDIIDLSRDYRFLVNGEPVEDDFSEESIVSLGDISYPLTVPENSYFVLGDNRNGSKDSRFSSVGCVEKKDIIGKISLRIWPFNKLGLI